MVWSSTVGSVCNGLLLIVTAITQPLQVCPSPCAQLDCRRIFPNPCNGLGFLPCSVAAGCAECYGECAAFVSAWDCSLAGTAICAQLDPSKSCVLRPGDTTTNQYGCGPLTSSGCPCLTGGAVMAVVGCPHAIPGGASLWPRC